MKLASTISILTFFVMLLKVAPVPAQDLPTDYQEVRTLLARSGDSKAKVLKISIPRSALHVTIAGQATPTPY